MAKYTAEIRTIIDNGFEIFDFTYTRKPESVAIISNEDLEQGFIDHYYFNEVGFETLERFKHRLKTQWLESLGELDALLIAYNSEIDPLTNLGQESENTTIFNDTPKNAVDYGEQSQSATSITHTKQKSKSYAGRTQIDLLEEYHDKIKDIQTEFYNSFENLFMTIL